MRKKKQKSHEGVRGDRKIRTPSLRGIKIKKSSRWRRKQKRRHRDDFLILRELAGCSGGLGAEPPAKNAGFSASAAGVWGRSPQQQKEDSARMMAPFARMMDPARVIILATRMIILATRMITPMVYYKPDDVPGGLKS